MDKMDESVRERPVSIDFPTTSCLSAPLPVLTLRFDEITEDYAELIAATLDSKSRKMPISQPDREILDILCRFTTVSAA